MRAVGIALLVATLAISGGCAQTGRWTRADYDLSSDVPPHEAELEDLSARIYLIADNQRHELLGNGVGWFRNAFSDSYFSPDAIRPPQLDLFGQDLLDEALAMSDGFVLHLGDACDISNTGEFGRFAWDMQRAPQGWVMAPGNHDGYLFGNSSRTVDGLIREWNEAAESYEFEGTKITSGAMQKDRYISYYLAALILQDEIWSAALARTLGPEIEKRFATWTRRNGNSGVVEVPRSFGQYWQELVLLQEQIYSVSELVGDQKYHTFELPEGLVPADQPHLRRLAWHIDKNRVWRSFILQEVDISASSTTTASDRISILVLDTSHYQVQPDLDHGFSSKLFSILTLGFVDVQVAGKTGNILESQEDATTEFSKYMNVEGRRWILASHHPFEEFGRRTPSRFNPVRDAGRIPVTLSAHTHSGNIRWNHDGDREGDWLEINVGSILDSPAEFRDFQVHRLGDRIAISSQRRLMENVLRERGLMLDDFPEYRPSSGDADFYLDYKSGLFGTEEEADFKVKRILLAAYVRMLSLFEADHPDQSSTNWPMGPYGLQLRSHKEVLAATQELLAEVQIAGVATLTRFLYELREFDRTRRFSAALGEQLRAYRLSQAIWAGRAELATWDEVAATSDPDISFLLLPRPAAETAMPVTGRADSP